MKEGINEVCGRLVYATNQIKLNNSFNILAKKAESAYKAHQDIKTRFGMEFVCELPEHWKHLTGVKIARLEPNKLILAHPERIPMIYDIQEKTYKEIKIEV